MKQTIVQLMTLSLQNIYCVCSKKCITQLNKFELLDTEKICLSKCFDRKNETFNMSMDGLTKFQQIYSQEQTHEPKPSFELS